jgi:hypothetical protein
MKAYITDAYDYVRVWSKNALIYKLDVLTALHADALCAATLRAKLKLHKNENFFGSDFEFCTISLLLMLNIKVS